MTDERVSPAAGGCWFCERDNGEMAFDAEFDTWVHLDCIRNAIEKDANNVEAQIMSYLLRKEIP